MSITPAFSSTTADIQITGAADYFLESLNKTTEVTASTESAVTQENQAEESSFADVLSDFLPAGTGQEINEEELFSAIIAERLENLKGSEGVASYQESLEKHLSAMEYSNGYVPVEDATRAALNDLVDQGILSLDEAESIHAQSFQAAQLDDNHTALYDSLGSTMAVTMVELALESSTQMLAAFDSGEQDAGKMSLDYQQDSGISAAAATSVGAGQSTTNTIGDGFLFKPISEGDGNLVVLLPSSMSGDVSELTIRDSSGQILAQGCDLGDYDDGRPLFRFSSPGGSYPNNITVTASLSNGKEYNYEIASPSQRYE
jgi:hypothetical protein